MIELDEIVRCVDYGYYATTLDVRLRVFNGPEAGSSKHRKTLVRALPPACPAEPLPAAPRQSPVRKSE